MKITNKEIKEIEKGNHAILMDCLDFLLDSYEENKFDLGYKSCLSDMGVYANRLAEELHKKAQNYGKRAFNNGEEYFTLEEEEITEFIEQYFNNLIKTYNHGRK